MKISRKMQTTFSFLFLLLMAFSRAHEISSHTEVEVQVQVQVQVGVILDMGSRIGKIVDSCIKMAVSDFYEANPQYNTRIVLHTRNTHGEPLIALSTALDLLENTKVQVVMGPESTIEAKFLDVLGEKAKVPMVSFSTSPSSNEHPYFLRVTEDETHQFKGVAAMAESFEWKNVVLVCEKTADGREMATYMAVAFREKNIQIAYTSLISTSPGNEQVSEELRKLVAMQTTVFVVHTSPYVASHLLSNAKELGMMGEGYVWVVTSKTADFLDLMDAEAIGSMQGVVGFKSYIPTSTGLRDLTLKWRKENYAVNPSMEFKELNAYGVWAYDAVYALAMAAERVQAKEQGTGTSAELLNQILRIKFQGLGGEFKLMNGRIVSKALEVVNVIGKGDRRVGFWTPNGEFVKEIRDRNSPSNNGLQSIIWPGGTTTFSRRKMLQTSGKKLRILVPYSLITFQNLISLTVDPRINSPTIGGFCGDVFNAAFNALNNGIDVDFIPYVFKVGGTYNELIDSVHLQDFDAAVGDITITSNRSLYVDFTLPFTDLGVGTLARNDNRSMWIFLDPLSTDLWITSAGFFLLLGFVIWVIEHRTNEEFQGSSAQQIGTTIWFALSTLVYAHREKLHSNLSRFVVSVWVFVVLVLTSSYTATLSSLLTVQQIQSKGGSIGFQALSPVGGVVFDNMKSAGSTLEPLGSPEAYAKLLRSGNVDAIVDEILYIKTVLAMYPTGEFSLTSTAATTNGFGFVFKKGSALAADMSTEIARLREDGTLKALEDKWFKPQSAFRSVDFAPKPEILSLHGFRGLFLVSGISMALALFISMLYFLHEKFCVIKKIHVNHTEDVHVEDLEQPQSGFQYS